MQYFLGFLALYLCHFVMNWNLSHAHSPKILLHKLRIEERYIFLDPWRTGIWLNFLNRWDPGLYSHGRLSQFFSTDGFINWIFPKKNSTNGFINLIFPKKIQLVIFFNWFFYQFFQLMIFSTNFLPFFSGRTHPGNEFFSSIHEINSVSLCD